MLEQNISHGGLNARSVLGMSRQVLVSPFVFFRSLRRHTKTAIPLPSDSLLHVISSPGDTMPKFSSESTLTREATTRSIVPYTGIPRRLRRQGWLMQLPFGRNFTLLEESISPPPSVLSASLVLRDVRNIHPEVNSVESVFSPQVVELSADDIHTPIIIIPVSPSLGCPIPIEMTQTQIECNSPVHFESPLGPSSLTLALPNGLPCLPEDEICPVDICPVDSARQLSKENDDSSLCLLDKFPQPPSVAEEKGCFITPASRDERGNSASKLKSPIDDTATGQDSERKTDQDGGVAVHIYAQERTVSSNSRNGYRLVGSYDESIKTSQSEIIFRPDTLPACGEVQRSFSMPFGVVPTKGLGFLQYYAASHVGLVQG